MARPLIHRRTFLERLGLGAGAALLGPAIGASVREAHGQAAGPKRFFLLVQGNGMDFADFAPYGHTPGELTKRGVADKQLYVADTFSLPPMFAALEPHKKNLLLVDGLSNFQGFGDHSIGYPALTCIPSTPVVHGKPGGPSFDQHLAKKIGRDSVFGALVLGTSGYANETASIRNTVFAFDKYKPAPVLSTVAAAYRVALASLVPGATSAPPPYTRRKKLLDLVRGDISRARSSLAGPERSKLDQVLSALEETDVRLGRLAGVRLDDNLLSSLSPKLRSPPGKLTLEDQLDLHFHIATTALLARLTNVIGLNAAAAGSSADTYWEKLGYRDCHELAHSRGADTSAARKNGTPPGNPGHGMNVIHNYHAGLLARTIESLQRVPEAGGSVFDNTVMAWLSDNPDQHHPQCNRAPTLLIASPGGYLKTGGRFVRFPVMPELPGSFSNTPNRAMVQGAKPSGGRCMADLFCSLGHAVGVPTDDFGGGEQGPSPEICKGPLQELRA